jgi:hypothetical protein
MTCESSCAVIGSTTPIFRHPWAEAGQHLQQVSALHRHPGTHREARLEGQRLDSGSQREENLTISCHKGCCERHKPASQAQVAKSPPAAAQRR